MNDLDHNKINFMAENKKNDKGQESLRKLTIKEFQWYEVQTKVRELLAQLLQPFNKKQTQQTIKINEIKRNIATMTKKLQDHDFLLIQEDAQKPTYVQLQDDKIEEINGKFLQLQTSQNLKICEMQKVIEVYENKIHQINNIQTRIQEETQVRMKETKDHKNHTDQQIQLMLKRLDAQTDEMNVLRVGTRNTISKLQTKIVTIDNRVIDLEDQIKRKASEIRKNFQSIQSSSQKIASHTHTIQQLQYRISDRQKDAKLSQKFLGKVMEVTNELSFIRNYIQLYQPLYNQMQISQTLNSFVKGTQKTRLSLFEETIFAKIHYAILTNTEDSLDSKMSDYSNKIRRIINRNKKYLIRLKVQQTFKYGTNVYELRQLDESLIRQQEQEAVAKPTPVIIPQQQINSIIEEKWEKLTANLEGKIKQNISPLTTWMSEIQEQSLMRIMESDKKFQDMKKVIQTESANMVLLKKEILQSEKATNEEFNSLHQGNKKMKEQVKDIINFCSVFNHIVIQDQIDRQGLALYALRGNQAQQTMPNIQLDQKCISCSNGNSSSIVNQAFKMACLAYNPSEIRIQDKIFTREEILEVSTNILQKLKKKIDNSPNISVQANQTFFQPKKTQKRSRSTFSRNTNFMRSDPNKTIEVSRTKDYNTLLPVLGSSKKKMPGPGDKQKSNHSVFY